MGVTMAKPERSEAARDSIITKTSEYAALYEARWTMNALMREAPDLHEALEDQIGMFQEALEQQDDAEIIAQGEATCRGWQAAITRMEKSDIANDALHIGQFGECVVAVGRAQKCPKWLREEYGDDLVYLTPRECAALYAKLEMVNEVKKEWPGAEIIDIREKQK